jgi:hypothetical protein
MSAWYTEIVTTLTGKPNSRGKLCMRDERTGKRIPRDQHPKRKTRICMEHTFVFGQYRCGCTPDQPCDYILRVAIWCLCCRDAPCACHEVPGYSSYFREGCLYKHLKPKAYCLQHFRAKTPARITP